MKRKSSSSSMTLESKLNERIREYDVRDRALADKRARLSAAQKLSDSESDVRAKMELDDQCKTLTSEIQRDEKNTELINYLLDVVPVLKDYYDDVHQVQQESVLDKQCAVDDVEEEDEVDVTPQPVVENKPTVMDFFHQNTNAVAAVTASEKDPGQIKRKQTKRPVPRPVGRKQSTSAQNKITSFVRSENESKRGTLYKKFMQVSNDTLNDLEYIDDSICATCNVSKIVHEDEAMLVCPNCGVSTTFIDTGITSIPFNSSVDYSSFSYKRINHFNEWLAQFQGKEKTIIPEEVLDKIRSEIKKTRQTDITAHTVRSILKKLKLQKFYEHVPQIANVINDIPPPCMTSAQEQTLRNCFRQIQHPFSEACPESRKNFLSYSYVLHKLCQLNAYDDFTQCFPLLKSREKLQDQDKIWEKICKTLNWEFIPSI